MMKSEHGYMTPLSTSMELEDPLATPISQEIKLFLTPLWEYVIRAQTLPESLDLDVFFETVHGRLRDPEWEVRQHALRVLVDFIPLIPSHVLDEKIASVLSDLVANLGHLGPAVRKGAVDSLRAYVNHSSKTDYVITDLVERGIEKAQENKVQTNVVLGIILSLPFLINNKLTDHTITYIIHKLLDKIVKVIHQETVLRALLRIREIIGYETFYDALATHESYNSRKEFELLCEVYDLHTFRNNSRASFRRGFSQPSPPSSTGSSFRQESFEQPSKTILKPYSAPENNTTTYVKTEDVLEDAPVINLTEDRVILETEIQLECGPAITMKIHEESGIRETSEDRNRTFKVLPDSDGEDYEHLRRTPRRVRFGGEIVKLRTPDSDSNNHSDDNEATISIISGENGDKPVIEIKYIENETRTTTRTTRSLIPIPVKQTQSEPNSPIRPNLHRSKLYKSSPNLSRSKKGIQLNKSRIPRRFNTEVRKSVETKIQIKISENPSRRKKTSSAPSKDKKAKMPTKPSEQPLLDKPKDNSKPKLKSPMPKKEEYTGVRRNSREDEFSPIPIHNEIQVLHNLTRSPSPVSRHRIVPDEPETKFPDISLTQKIGEKPRRNGVIHSAEAKIRSKPLTPPEKDDNFPSFQVYNSTLNDGFYGFADSPIPTKDSGECLTCSSSGSDTVILERKKMDQFSVLDERIIEDLQNMEDVRARQRGLEELLRVIQNPNIMDALQGRLPSLLYILFMAEQQPMLQPIAEQTLSILFTSMNQQSLIARLQQISLNLSKMGSPLGVRLAILLMRRIPPGLLVDQLLSDPILGAKSSKVREGALQILMTVSRIFPSTDMNVPKSSKSVIATLRDKKRRVRQAALETLAALAQLSSPMAILDAANEVTTDWSDRDQILRVIRTRLSRKQLPTVNMNGSIRYSTPTGESEIEWLSRGSGAASPQQSARNIRRFSALPQDANNNSDEDLQEKRKRFYSAQTETLTTNDSGPDTQNENEEPNGFVVLQEPKEFLEESFSSEQKSADPETTEEDQKLYSQDTLDIPQKSIIRLQDSSQDDSFNASQEERFNISEEERDVSQEDRSGNIIRLQDSQDSSFNASRKEGSGSSTESQEHRNAKTVRLQDSQDGGFSATQKERNGSFSVPQDQRNGKILRLQDSQDASFSVPQKERSGSFSVPQEQRNGKILRLQDSQDGSFSVPQKERSGSFSVSQEQRNGKIIRLHESQDSSFSVPQKERSGSFSVSQELRNGKVIRLQDSSLDGGFNVSQKDRNGGFSVSQEQRNGKGPADGGRFAVEDIRSPRRFVPETEETLDERFTRRNREMQTGSALYGRRYSQGDGAYDRNEEGYNGHKVNYWKHNLRRQMISGDEDDGGGGSDWSRGSGEEPAGRAPTTQIWAIDPTAFGAPEKLSTANGSLRQIYLVKSNESKTAATNTPPHDYKEGATNTTPLYGRRPPTRGRSFSPSTRSNKQSDYDSYEEQDSARFVRTSYKREVQRIRREERVRKSYSTEHLSNVERLRKENVVSSGSSSGSSVRQTGNWHRDLRSGIPVPIHSDSKLRLRNRSNYKPERKGPLSIPYYPPVKSPSPQTTPEKFTLPEQPHIIGRQPFSSGSESSGYFTPPPEQNAREETPQPSPEPEHRTPTAQPERFIQIETPKHSVENFTVVDSEPETLVDDEEDEEEEEEQIEDTQEPTEAAKPDPPPDEPIPPKSATQSLGETDFTQITYSEKRALSKSDYDIQISTHITRKSVSSAPSLNDFQAYEEPPPTKTSLPGSIADSLEDTEAPEDLYSSPQKIPAKKLVPKSSVRRKTKSTGAVSVYPDNLRPYPKPKEGYHEIVEQLESSEWEVTMKGLQGLVRLIRHHKELVENQMHAICVLLGKQIRNLRSQVARAACLAASELFAIGKRPLELEVDELAGPLLHRTADTNKFLRSDANAALDDMCANLSIPKVIHVVTQRGCGHQNAVVRCAAARLLANIVHRLGAEKVFQLPRDSRDRILSSGANMLTEGSLETRKYAKLLLGNLANHSQFQRALSEAVPASVLRHIDKTLRSLTK